MAEPEHLNIPESGAPFAEAEGRPVVDWAEVRRAYEVTGLPTVELQRRFGVTRSQIRWRQGREGWRKRLAPQRVDAVTRLGSASPRRLRSRVLCLAHLSLSGIELNAVGGRAVDPGAAGALASLCSAWAYLAYGPERGETMGKRRGTRGMDDTAAGMADGAAYNKKKNNEPGYRGRHAGGDFAGGDHLDRRRAEVKARLERVREAERRRDRRAPERIDE